MARRAGRRRLVPGTSVESCRCRRGLIQATGSGPLTQGCRRARGPTRLTPARGSSPRAPVQPLAPRPRTGLASAGPLSLTAGSAPPRPPGTEKRPRQEQTRLGRRPGPSRREEAPGIEGLLLAQQVIVGAPQPRRQGAQRLGLAVLFLASGQPPLGLFAGADQQARRLATGPL